VEFVIGREVTMLDQHNPKIVELVMDKLVDFHYNEDMVEQSKKIKGANSMFLKTLWDEQGLFTLTQKRREAVNWEVISDPHAAPI
jgi:hypothetical protein